MQCLPGVLVECDASIKAIIVKINSENQNIYIIEDIDDEHVLIQAAKHDELKARLNAVCLDSTSLTICRIVLTQRRHSKTPSASLRSLSPNDESTSGSRQLQGDMLATLLVDFSNRTVHEFCHRTRHTVITD